MIETITNDYETRKLNHIRQALNPHDRNHDFQKAIVAAFKEEGIDPYDMWIDLAGSAHNQQQYNVHKEKILRVFDKYFESEIVEYHRQYDTAPTREKHYILKFDSKRNGLNEKVGGGAKYQPLPLYDIAHLICLGYNVKQITEILNDKYEEFHISRPLISRRLSQIAVFGSLFQAQEELLQPLIEELLEKGIDAYKIFNYFKNNLGSTRRGNSWFTSWAFGDAILKDGITRYFGVTHAEWERILIEDWNYQKIEETYGLKENNVKNVMREVFGGKYQAMRRLRRFRTLELLKEDWSFEDIYRNDFTCSGNDASMREYFVKLFKGFNNVDHYWSLEEIKGFAKTGFLGTI